MYRLHHYCLSLRKWESHLVSLRIFLPFSTAATAPSPQPGSVVDYLTQRCGFPREKAVKASSLFTRAHSIERFDSVVDFLKRSGFDDAQVKNLISMRPNFLRCNVERTLKPKIQFFNSVGFFGNDLAELILRCPDVLRRSVEEHLEPAFKLLRDYLGSDKNIQIALKRCHGLLAANHLKIIEPKFVLLRGLGVPDKQIVKLFLKNPRFFMHKTLLERNITRLENFRVQCSPTTLIHAISSIATMSADTFEAKCMFLKSCGWSEEHIASAFQKTPYFLMSSESKFQAVMDLFVNELGYKPSEVSPKMFGISLEKRLRPRTQVLQILRSNGLLKKICKPKKGLLKKICKPEKGLLKKDVNWCTAMLLTDYTFFRRFVLPFKGKYPELEKITGFTFPSESDKSKGTLLL